VVAAVVASTDPDEDMGSGGVPSQAVDDKETPSEVGSQLFCLHQVMLYADDPCLHHPANDVLGLYG
jgi:hypothetical protein